MIEFEPITIEHKDRIDRINSITSTRQCDYGSGALFLWRNVWDHQVAFVDDFFLYKWIENGETLFSFPIGTGDVGPVIAKLIDYTREAHIPLVFGRMDKQYIEALSQKYPGAFEYTDDRDSYEYISEAAKFTTFSGRALRGKKRPCNHFEAEHDWTFTELTPEDIPECRDFLRQWEQDNIDRAGELVEEELPAIYDIMEYYDSLHAVGGILRTEGRIVGFSAGSLINEDCFDTSFEKAIYDLDGAYAMTCRELTKLVLSKYPGVVYINREEDMGLESLRHAKMMMDPCFLIEKCTAVYRSDI